MNTLKDGEVIDYVKGTGVYMDPRFVATGEVIQPARSLTPPIIEPATTPARVAPKMQAYGSMLPKSAATSVVTDYISQSTVIDTATPSTAQLIKIDLQNYIQSLESVGAENASIEGAIRALRQVQKMVEKRINASMDR